MTSCAADLPSSSSQAASERTNLPEAIWPVSSTTAPSCVALTCGSQGRGGKGRGGTHDARIDAQEALEAALSAHGGDGIGEQRDAAALAAHEHVALVVCDDV